MAMKLLVLKPIHATSWSLFGTQPRGKGFKVPNCVHIFQFKHVFVRIHCIFVHIDLYM